MEPNISHCEIRRGIYNWKKLLGMELQLMEEYSSTHYKQSYNAKIESTVYHGSIVLFKKNPVVLTKGFFWF